MQLRGIDISKYQGNIDWATVKANGCNFAMIRVGFCGYDGTITIDEKYHQNMKNAIANGVDVGVYLYSYAKSTTAAIYAAQQTLELVKPYTLTYPIAFDVEDKVYTEQSTATNDSIVCAFLNEIIKAKYYGLLYTYTNFSQNYLSAESLNKYDVWIADYRANLGYKGSYTMWQYSSKGAVNGITGNVDMNWGYKDYPTIIKNCGYNGFEGEKGMLYYLKVGKFPKDRIWLKEFQAEVNAFPNKPSNFIEQASDGLYFLCIGGYYNKAEAESMKALVGATKSKPYCQIYEYKDTDQLPIATEVSVVPVEEHNKVVNELINTKTELANSKLQLETYKQTQVATSNELTKVKTDLKNATDETIRLTNENAFLKDDVSAKDKIIVENKNTIEVLNDTIKDLKSEIKKLNEALVCKGEVKSISVGDALAVLFKTIKDAFKKS